MYLERFQSLLVVTLINMILFNVSTTHCFEFDRNNFGVVFQPYVKTQAKNGDLVSSIQSYKSEDLKRMLSVVSRKFTKVMVTSEFMYHETYTQNFTYQVGSYPSAFSGEAAALLNLKENNPILQLLFHVVVSRFENVTEARILLALESAEKANHIFPGTVKGISFARARNSLQLGHTLSLLKSLKGKTAQVGVKFGAELNCSSLLDQENETIQRRIVEKSDYIICGAKASNKNLKSGPYASFHVVASSLLQFREAIRKINKKAKVIGTTKWSSSESRKWETAENLKTYWETASKWALEHKYSLYLKEAFDNPFRWKKASWAHLGWWKLTDNSQVNSLNGYLEKISAHPANRNISENSNVTLNVLDRMRNATKKQHSNHLSLSQTLTSFGPVSAAVVILITLMSIRIWMKRKTLLSANELRNFFFGVPIPEHCVASGLDTALNSPYNKIIEIPREKIKIENSQVLGIGHFGCVLRAVIESDEGGETLVAVKVAKSNCPSIALNGLLSEIKILSYLGEHENIIALKGAYTTELTRGIVYVITEICSLGSLQKFLRSRQQDAVQGHCETSFASKDGSVVAFNDMVRWSCEIACGMEHLERKHVVHADLATRNVLLTSEKVAKITDFGLSRRMYNYVNYVKKQGEPLPWRWMSVEALKRLEFSSKSDVWSFGVTLWEIFSLGDVPYPGQICDQSFINQLASGLRPGCPQLATCEIYQIMCRCWNLRPKDRPNFQELLQICRDNYSQSKNKDEESVYLHLVDNK